MKYSENDDLGLMKYIRYEVGGTRNEEFASSRFNSWPAKMRMIGQERHGGSNVLGKTPGSLWLISGDEAPYMGEIFYRARRPAYFHEGGGNSCLVPHVDSHLSTAL